MARNRQAQADPTPAPYALFADALEQEIVFLRAITLTATGDAEVTERIVVGFLLSVLDREITPPVEVDQDVIEALYLDYLRDVLETDMVKVALGSNVSVFLSLEQLSEAIR
ncbi:MAG: hypothetical protein KJ871_16160 [Alphaproteobacteria bacterium]|nr:hypothetical protein [Alphaproteobacteria bacterium]MBU2084590.1 hypothetical protein [Alphaproteobacteria bacterium]MBU2141999.1 hypothetical protein [Alphaproteobacteria bacterium]MBU2198389.1 hypothetical protein [Alphaproteobacteria bacterium]